jgi:alpha-tubulin suppressor-like RCC1 family protein
VVAVVLVIAGGVVLIPRGSEGNSGAAAPVSSGLAPSSVSVPSTALTTPAPTSTATVPASAPTILDAGDFHACAVTVGGGLKCWGANTDGQLGDGTTTVRLTPRGVAGLASGVRAVTAGGEHTCAVTTGGSVKCWGNNNSFQLSDGTLLDRSSPVDVLGLGSGVLAVTAGGQHTCAVTSGGAVFCWGNNSYGQLGDGTTGNQSTPVDVVGLVSGVRSVTAGAEHTCAVTSGGAVKCWGYNTDGQLGDGSSGNQSSPVDVVGLGSGVQAISAGGQHTCALTGEGAVKCWGDNTAGQLGVTSVGDQWLPVDVVGLGSGVQAISAGGQHTCALTSEGAVKCWGDNTAGQLGDDTTQNQTAPVDVVGLGSGAQAVSAGLHHTCAMTISGKVECWGANDSGQLGDGTLPVDWSDVDVATDLLAGWYSGVCKGRKVVISAPYKGKSHPLVILGPGSDQNKWAVKLARKGAPKGLRPTGIEKVQLVVCITQKLKSAPACGTYVRSSDHVRGTLRRRKDVVTVRIVVASTGKEIRRNTFTRMPKCPTRTSVGSAGPPWYLNTVRVSAKTPLPYMVRFTKGSVLR